MADSQADATIETDKAPTLNTMHEQPIICMSDDNGKAAIDYNMAGSMKVGGGRQWIASALSAPATTRASVTST